MGLMFMLASSSPEDDRNPSESCAGLSVNCRAIYFKHQSEASTFPHPGCSEALLFVRQVRRCWKPNDQVTGPNDRIPELAMTA